MTPERAVKILERRTVEGDQFIELVESLTQQNPDLDLWFEKRKGYGVYLIVEGVEHRVKVEHIYALPDMPNKLEDGDIAQLCDVVVAYLQNPRREHNWPEIKAKALVLLQDRRSHGKGTRWWADELGVPKTTLFRKSNEVGQLIKDVCNM